MIGALQRTTIAFKTMVACYLSETAVDSTIQIKNNVCQGSFGHGFALPYVSCDDIEEKWMYNNLAGSTEIGFIFGRMGGSCQAAADIKVYASMQCVMNHAPQTTAVKFKRMALADCYGRAFNLRFGHPDSDDSTANVDDMYINAISRPNCDYCYGDSAIPCSNQEALRLLTTTINGESLPDKSGTGYDVICRTETFDCKAFLRNIKFKNYRSSYSEAGLASCGSNYLFRPHESASDLSGSHHFWTSSCQNCSMDAMGRFDEPKQSELGWFGGCGDIVCTGKRNYLIEDHDGGLTGTANGGTFVPANPEVAIPLGCTNYATGANAAMNGYFCERHDLAILEYESKAADKDLRIMWPVNLTREHETEKYSHLTNAYKEWEWDGNEPLNRRLGRFISILNVNSTYNMTYLSEPPHVLKLQLQKRVETGNPDDWVIIKLHYPRPQSIRITTRRLKDINPATNKPRETVIKPLPEISGADGYMKRVTDNKTECGRNIYFHNNYTTHFLMTGD